MELQLTDAERAALRALQRQHRDGPGYVQMTVVVLLDKGRSVPYIADDLGLDPATVYRYAAAYQTQSLTAWLRPETGGYWGLLTSAQPGRLCQELDQRVDTDCRPIRHWLRATCGVTYATSGLTDLLHRLGYPYKLTTAVPCEANAAVQEAFVADTLAPLLAQAEAGTAVVYFADAAHPTPNTRATHGWTQVGKECPLATVSGRERANLNAARNAVVPTQILLDETDYVHAQRTQRLYEKLLVARPRKSDLRRLRQRRLLQKQELDGLADGQPLRASFSAHLFRRIST